MPRHEHEVYRRHVLEWSRANSWDPDVVAALERYGEAALILWHLDLSAAQPILLQGYAENSRGIKPRDPIVTLRGLLLSLLVGQPSLNKWVADLKASRVLRVLCGLDPKDAPGVGTLYDFMHRLHNGSSQRPCPHGERPSDTERRRSQSPKKRKRGKKRTKAERRTRKKRRQKNPITADTAIDDSVTGKVVETLVSSQTLPNANDLLMRLGQLLLEVGVKESAKRGLLGDTSELLVCGDGSSLPTGANRHGKRLCQCKDLKKCECPRLYSDPDADIGYDSHRDIYFFGHHLYEFVVASKGGHDLPLALRVDPASTSDFVASLKGLEHLRKLLRDHSDFKIGALILDAGHDGKNVYKFIIHHDISPVIPLKTSAPAEHPQKKGVRLSRRGVPLCPAGAEMIYLGTSRKKNQVFGCPVKAKKLARCPHAPESRPNFSCQPLQKVGPTVTIKTELNPRLCPPVPRNQLLYRKLMNLRSGCERSFSVKKERFKLVQARHRRRSFWMIRSLLIAMLQHASAWVAKEDAKGFVDHLLGRKALMNAA